MTQRAVLCRIRAGFRSFSYVPYEQSGREFIAKLGERIFTNRQLGVTAYIRIEMTVVS